MQWVPIHACQNKYALRGAEYDQWYTTIIRCIEGAPTIEITCGIKIIDQFPMLNGQSELVFLPHPRFLMVSIESKGGSITLDPVKMRVPACDINDAMMGLL